MERNVVMIKNDVMSIIEKIKTFEDAMEATGRKEMPDFSSFPEDMRKHFEALFKMVVIVEALNEGWKPDWDNYNECKYYPWFEMSPSSFAFRGSDCGYVNEYAHAGSGSRLKLKSRELAEYCGEQFKDIWKDIQLG